MTPAEARHLLEVQAGFGDGFNRHGARLIATEFGGEHGRAVADRPIRDLGLDAALGIGPGAPPPSGDA
jgi:hypothetical protein